MRPAAAGRLIYHRPAERPICLCPDTSNPASPARWPSTLGAPHVGAGASVDFDHLAFLDEQWDVYRLASLKHSWLGHVRGCITSQTFWSFDNFELNRSRQLHLHRPSSRRENLDPQVLDQIIFCTRK